jgi:hypothetical protein
MPTPKPTTRLSTRLIHIDGSLAIPEKITKLSRKVFMQLVKVEILVSNCTHKIVGLYLQRKYGHLSIRELSGK